VTVGNAAAFGGTMSPVIGGGGSLDAMPVPEPSALLFLAAFVVFAAIFRLRRSFARVAGWPAPPCGGIPKAPFPRK
jgi:hypothetical protein